MLLNELAKTQEDPKVEQAWDAWDEQIEADLQAGKLDSMIIAAKGEAASAEAF